MKRFLWIWIVLLLCVATAEARGFKNNPLPEQPDTLRILGVGNSFTDDGMMYLPDLLREAGVENVVLGRLYVPGCSLEQHCCFYAQDEDPYIYYKSIDNKWVTVDESAMLTEALADERWDVIVMQQASHFSGLYATYSPWLDKLIAIILSHNSNPDLCLAWQMTWAYASDTDNTGFANYDNDQQQMFDAIVSTTQRVMVENGVDVLTPAGVAIQKLRDIGFGSLRDMTRDGYHLDLGVGRYTAACTWFEALIEPVLSVSVKGNTFRIPAAEPQTTPVTDANAAMCQDAALAAVASSYTQREGEK